MNKKSDSNEKIHFLNANFKQISIALLLAILAVAIFSFFYTRSKFRTLYRLYLEERIPTDSAAAGKLEELPFKITELPRLGYEESPVKIIIVTDFECPNCKQLEKEVLSRLREDFVLKGLVQLIYADYPLSSHPNAFPAAQAVWAAREQNRFWRMYDALFRQEVLSETLFFKLAGDFGLDMDRFSRDYSSTDIRNRIQRNIEAAQSLQIPGVPVLIVNGELLVGLQEYEAVTGLIQKMLSETTENISIRNAAKELKTAQTVFLDVRTAREYSEGSIPGAVNIDYRSPDFLNTTTEKIERDTPIIIYCKSGTRSARAYHLLRMAGYSNVKNMAAGYDKWR